MLLLQVGKAATTREGSRRAGSVAVRDELVVVNSAEGGVALSRWVVAKPIHWIHSMEEVAVVERVGGRLG